jgi:glycosyltransferase involved in cell wall biosynthesis
MRVLFLEQQPCIRALKIGVGLRSAIPALELGFAYQGKSLTEWYGAGDETFDRLWRLTGDARPALAAVLEEFQPELVHSHNLPDALTVLATALVAGRVPVIHDVHDLQSLRKTPYEDGFPEPGDPIDLERRAIEGSDALVTVSAELLAEIRSRYKVPGHTLVFPNYALRRDLPRLLAFSEHRVSVPQRLVYQGTLSVNGGHYDLREIFGALVGTGVSLDVYPNRDVPEYHDLASRLPGLTVHKPLSPADLLRELPSYDFGWCGFNETLNKAHLDTALPNKLYEYLACGLPVLAFPHRAITHVLKEQGLGIVVESARELGPELARRDLAKLRQRVGAARGRLTVEANIASVVELYEALVAAPRAAVSS